MIDDVRPAPVPTPESQPFWEGCAAGELRLCTCAACGEHNWFPRAICRACGSADITWAAARGTGAVYSYSVVHRAATTAFPVPYVLALVDLDEGVRLMTNIVDCPVDAVDVGMRVGVVFQAGQEYPLPFFRPLP